MISWWPTWRWKGWPTWSWTWWPTIKKKRHQHGNPIWLESWSRVWLIGPKIFDPKFIRLAHFLSVASCFFLLEFMSSLLSSIVTIIVILFFFVNLHIYKPFRRSTMRLSSVDIHSYWNFKPSFLRLNPHTHCLPLSHFSSSESKRWKLCPLHSLLWQKNTMQW